MVSPADLYTRLLLAAAVPTGLVAAAIAAAVPLPGAAFFLFVTATTLAAVAASALLVRAHIAAVAGATPAGEPLELSPRLSRVLTLPLGVRQAESVAYYAMTALPARITINDPIRQRLEAKTRAALMRCGEVISIDVRPLAHGVQVRVSSRPKLRTTLVDFGRSRRIVDLLVARLLAERPSVVLV
jgi:hypothetical protein